MPAEILAPIDIIIPISKFARGGASKEFVKVKNDTPVTVLQNSEPTYFILSADDCCSLREIEYQWLNLEARQQGLDGEGESFDSIDALMADLHD